MDEIRFNIELLLKVSSRPGSGFEGEATFIFPGETHHFDSITELAWLIEQKAHESCPHLEHRLRSWARAPSTTPRSQSSEPKATGHHRQTLHVSIQFAENYTWQGKIQWLEGRRSLHFRSFLELMRLMDEAARTATREVSVSIIL